jgi:hypothetical protein
MRSHFRINSSAAIASAVAGAATMLSGHCTAQPLVAADYATNSIYNSGWSAGQNGGYGFGPWGFDSSDPAGAPLQSLSTASALGTAWTLFTTNQPDAMGKIGGLANAGRAILEPGGLQVGQTFQAVIQNPVNNAGITTYRGFDILFTSNTTNDPPGVNTAALRLTVFDYVNPSMYWAITDAASQPRSTLSAMTSGTSGMIIALTLNSTNTYTLVMSPVSNPNSPYLTFSGTLANQLPINYFNFRNWNNPTTGTNDVADNFGISSMTIEAAPSITLNIQPAGANVVLSWSTNATNFVLASSPSLSNGSVWSTNLPAPVVNGNLNFVTNPISGPQQFFRLQSP